MEEREDTEHNLKDAEEILEAEQPQSEPEAIPLGPETQAIIIQSIN